MEGQRSLWWNWQARKIIEMGIEETVGNHTKQKTIKKNKEKTLSYKEITKLGIQIIIKKR